jgi:hypothetical protein
MGGAANSASPIFASRVSMLLRYLAVASLLAGSIASLAANDNAAAGVLEGHLSILSLKEVELADAENTKTTTPPDYAEYPLVVLSRDRKQEVARLTVDANGNYRAELPSGDYVLDVQDRVHKHLRARPQPFTVLSNQTVRVDMDIDTGIR